MFVSLQILTILSACWCNIEGKLKVDFIESICRKLVLYVCVGLLLQLLVVGSDLLRIASQMFWNALSEYKSSEREKGNTGKSVRHESCLLRHLRLPTQSVISPYLAGRAFWGVTLRSVIMGSIPGLSV
ncbi:hypothetical protein Tco_0158314 [Tanacetum coccineum]